MVRYFLLESCRPDDKYLLSVRDDLERKLTEEGDFYVERVNSQFWIRLWRFEGCFQWVRVLERI